MITFGLNYTVKKESIEPFLEIAQKVLGLMDSIEGHVATKLYNDVNKSSSYLIYSEWQTQENFTAFMRSQAFKDVQNMSVDMLEERPKHQIYETKKMH